MTDSVREQESRREYREYLARTYREHFGVRDAAQSAGIADDWFSIDARHAKHFTALNHYLPEAGRILDLASGMGTTTLYGLSQGYDGYGIEPDEEKLDLMRRRIAAGILPDTWASRFARAVGERLPYRDRTFDAILSYQTLEHVQDIDAVLAEMLRVVKPGGALHLRCPDYRGTFEGHYLVPWLPLMPRRLARVYLRLRGRPVTELSGIVYTTRSGIKRSLEAAAARASMTLAITDLECERIRVRLREKGLPAGNAMVLLAEGAQYLRRLFRADTQINLWVSRLT